MVKRARVLLEPREFPCDILLWGYMKDLVYSILIDTIEILREQVGKKHYKNKAELKFEQQIIVKITEECWKERRIISSAASLLN
jgi:hypothetical protein